MPVPAMCESVASRVVAMQYSEFVCTESVPAPAGKRNRASTAETDWIVQFRIMRSLFIFCNPIPLRH